MESANLDTIILATANNYPDALAIAPFAARQGTPILFTLGESLPHETKQALGTWGIRKVIIVGGTGVIAPSVEDEIKNNLGLNTERLAGPDRYETALASAPEITGKWWWPPGKALPTLWPAPPLPPKMVVPSS